MTDERKVIFWENIKAGSFVSLTDKASLKKSYEENKDFNGLNLKILNIDTFISDNINLKIILIKLEKNKKIIVRIMGKEYFDISLCDEIIEDYFSPCTRKVAITNEWFWLFQEPNDVNNFSLTELDYTKSLCYNYNDTDFEFSQSKVGLILGYQIINNRKVDTVICEYINENSNKEFYEKIILIEEGYGNKDGGFITLLKSKEISLEEIEIY